MSDAKEEQIVAAIETIISTLTVAGASTAQLFLTTGRGIPSETNLTKDRRPAAYVWILQDRRAEKQETYELSVRDALVGVIVHCAAQSLTEKDQESIRLRRRLEAALEGNTLGGLVKAELRYKGFDTRYANDAVPYGTTMPFFQFQYYYRRGQPFIGGGS